MIEQWQLDCVRRILTIDGVKLTKIISSDHSPGQDLDKQALFRLYTGRSARKGPRRLVSLESLLSRIPSDNSSTVEKIGSFNDCDEDNLRGIRESKLDFLLFFGSETLPREILTLPRYGVWSFRSDDGTNQGGSPDCFWQVYNDQRVSGIVLERQIDQDVCEMMNTAYFKTIRSSYFRNLDQTLSWSGVMAAQVCTRLQNGTAHMNVAEACKPMTRSFRPPSNLQMCTFFLKTIKRRVEDFCRQLFRYTSWNVGIVHSPIHAFLDPEFRPEILWLPQSRQAHIQADPFGRTIDGKITVLFEVMDYMHRKGKICALEVEADGSVLKGRVVIESQVHMSYPFLFEHEGGTYCIPETNQAREVPIYRSVKFPDEWIKAGQLLANVRAIDTTVFKHNDRWWATFTDREAGGDANLYIWHSPDLWGPWEPHILNPVKIDIRSSRPGGTTFEHGGQLYRPAQDCSKTGGGRIILNRVEELSPTDFRERPVAVLAPYKNSPYREGFHTLSAAGDFTLIDGKRFRFLPSGLLTNLIKALRRSADRIHNH